MAWPHAQSFCLGRNAPGPEGRTRKGGSSGTGGLYLNSGLVGFFLGPNQNPRPETAM